MQVGQILYFNEGIWYLSNILGRGHITLVAARYKGQPRHIPQLERAVPRRMKLVKINQVAVTQRFKKRRVQ